MLAACCCVSMPSATVAMFIDRPIAMIARASAGDLGSASASWTNSPAILRMSIGNWRRWLSEK